LLPGDVIDEVLGRQLAGPSNSIVTNALPSVNSNISTPVEPSVVFPGQRRSTSAHVPHVASALSLSLLRCFPGESGHVTTS
jgi:hypothetical protein